MTDFKKAFAVSAKGWSVNQTACSLGANVLWPGDEGTFTFFLKPGQPLKGAVCRPPGIEQLLAGLTIDRFKYPLDCRVTDLHGPSHRLVNGVRIKELP